jgi:hypothetical protein
MSRESRTASKAGTADPIANAKGTRMSHGADGADRAVIASPRAMRSEPDALTERTPHVDHVLSPDLQAPVGTVRRRKDQDLALLEHAVEGGEPVIAYVGIGADDARPGP